METLKSVALGVLVIDKAVSHISSKYQQSFLKKIISPGSKLGHYPDIGKEVRDLLYADYNRGLKFSFHDDFLSGDLTKLRKKRPCVGHFAFQKSLKTATLALRIDTDSAILISSKVEAVAPGLTPGLSCILNVNVPDQNSGKIELHLLRRRVSLITSLGLFKNPTLAVSGLVGNDYWALGADVSMNTKTHDLTTLCGGFRWTGNGVIASLTVEEKGRFVKGQYYYPFSNTAIGAELSFNVARKRLSTFAFGVQNHYGPTDVKARFSNEGIACVLQQTWSSGSCFRLSVEKCSKKAPLIGVAVAFVA